MYRYRITQRRKRDWLSKKKSLGEKHPDTLEALNSFNNSLWREELYNELLPSLMQYYHLLCEVKGKDHPDTLVKLNELGVLLFTLEKYNESAEKLAQAFILRKLVLGPAHSLTLQSQKNLIVALRCAFRFPDSMKMAREMYNICKKEKGEKAEDTLFALKEEVLGCYFSGYEQRALELEKQYIESRKENGENDTQLLSEYEELSTILNFLHYFDQLVPVREKILLITEAAEGRTAEKTLKAMDQYASSLRKQSKSLTGDAKTKSTALTVTRELWCRRKEALGLTHADTLKAMEETVECLDFLCRYTEAINLQKELLCIYQANDKSRDSAENAMACLLELYLKDGQKEAAGELADQALQSLLSEEPLNEKQILRIRGIMQREHLSQNPQEE
ncbi:MAG: hypothetical protein Q4D81_06690 [Eubacteriales bacterium]|nr:hypothetical protein [Eubacteriales bacterium]